MKVLDPIFWNLRKHALVIFGYAFCGFRYVQVYEREAMVSPLCLLWFSVIPFMVSVMVFTLTVSPLCLLWYFDYTFCDFDFVYCDLRLCHVWLGHVWLDVMQPTNFKSHFNTQTLFFWSSNSALKLVSFSCNSTLKLITISSLP